MPQPADTIKPITALQRQQVTAQAIGVGATVIYTAIATLIILKVIDAIVGLRVNEEDESEGLDISQHDERGYIL